MTLLLLCFDGMYIQKVCVYKYETVYMYKCMCVCVYVCINIKYMQGLPWWRSG